MTLAIFFLDVFGLTQAGKIRNFVENCVSASKKTEEMKEKIFVYNTHCISSESNTDEKSTDNNFNILE